MTAKPQIPLTIIIPVFARPDKLARAVASIAMQDVSPAEVIVVDDGSDPPILREDVAPADLPL
ncbi:glycosyltransferase, partial [Hyphomicrobium sp.]|uniref:glycosyltransferase family 2 protein n=1 Tax=Hyphomicrobium sp. TaxID=82 RepID=UPI0025C736D3